MADERIKRLTELARRIWPQHAEALRITTDQHNAQLWIGDVATLVWIGHAQALDALEAALLVLTGEGPRERARAFFREAAELTGPEPHGMLAVGHDLPPAWVEELAREWLAEAERLNAKRSPGRWSWYEELADRLVRCAAELRARAKGGER